MYSREVSFLISYSPNGVEQSSVSERFLGLLALPPGFLAKRDYTLRLANDMANPPVCLSSVCDQWRIQGGGGRPPID